MGVGWGVGAWRLPAEVPWAPAVCAGASGPMSVLWVHRPLSP